MVLSFLVLHNKYLLSKIYHTNIHICQTKNNPKEYYAQISSGLVTVGTPSGQDYSGISGRAQPSR